MYSSRTKSDLIIEVWEDLDCESVGANEIRSIESAVMERFGESAVDSPMVLARLLADEGAVLRHAEIMQLYLSRAKHRPREPELRNILNTEDLATTLASLRSLENLRKKYLAENDKKGLRLMRELVLNEKQTIQERQIRGALGEAVNLRKEIEEWLTIWLGSPDVFETWVGLRKASEEFRSKFGSAKSTRSER